MDRPKNASEYHLVGVQKEIALSEEISSIKDPMQLLEIYEGIFGSMVVRLERLFGEEHLLLIFESTIETIRKIKNKKSH